MFSLFRLVTQHERQRLFTFLIGQVQTKPYNSEATTKILTKLAGIVFENSSTETIGQKVWL
jgi:hypothetical protein